MKRSTFSGEEIVNAIQQAEADAPSEIAAELTGGKEATFYAEKKNTVD